MSTIDLTTIYEHWHDKPAPVDGIRLTIMPIEKNCEDGALVLIAHVVEFVESGHTIFPMGPKPAHGLYVDGNAISATPAHRNDSLTPLDYDGPILASPGIDINYEITRLSLPTGTHEIVWRVGDRVSNTLRVTVSRSKN